MPDLADAAGLVARSHNEGMRAVLAYAQWRSPRSERPWGTYIAYLIALLRISDYLQIDAARAPAALLHLIGPKSPISIREWDAHAQVATVTWQSTGQIYVEATGRQTLATHLHLKRLVEAIQDELDTSVGVLDDFYRGPLAALRLSIRRITSNLDAEGLIAQLPYVPIPASVTATLDLVRLLLTPLYGNDGSIAGRELVQNAVDAVRARDRWDHEHNTGANHPRHPITVEIRELDPATAILEVSDSGIGMTPATVRSVFLAAGATLPLSAGDLADMSESQARHWLKTGRFGIGALAPFILGSSVRVTTRHVTERRGVTFEVDLLGRNIELRWVDDAAVGTTVQVLFDPGSVELAEHATRGWGEAGRKRLYRALASAIRDWWRAAWPRLDVPQAREREEGLWEVPDVDDHPPNDWVVFPAPELTRAMWRRDSEGAQLIHNGFIVARTSAGGKMAYDWTDSDLNYLFRTPDVAMVDAAHTVPLTLKRDALQTRALPFEQELLFSIGRTMALNARQGTADLSCMIAGARMRVHSRRGWVPLVPCLLDRLGVQDCLAHIRLERLRIPELESASSIMDVVGQTWPDAEHGLELKETLGASLNLSEAVEMAAKPLIRTRPPLWSIPVGFAVAWGDWRGLKWPGGPSGRPPPDAELKWPVVAQDKALGGQSMRLYQVWGAHNFSMIERVLLAARALVRGRRGLTILAVLQCRPTASGQESFVNGWMSELGGFAPPAGGSGV
jgi:hypothetical protein